MLRMFSREQRSHVQTRRPRSTAVDHVNGGGSLGAGVEQTAQATTVVEWSWIMSFTPSLSTSWTTFLTRARRTTR
jgi:hypothetical protein